ncbi:MAG: PIN domain-containing protein [Verrucomicrobiales bacterium]|nr:PIN domain-containing protein [Verrucomicrobiales bacterium]
MPKNILADSSALVALISRDDQYHQWIEAHLDSLSGPWLTCEAALSEAFHLLGSRGSLQLMTMLRRNALRPIFDLGDDLEPVLVLMEKYCNVPMSLADACFVRLSEILPDPMVVSTDADFRIYRRHSRQVVPCLLP